MSIDVAALIAASSWKGWFESTRKGELIRREQVVRHAAAAGCAVVIGEETTHHGTLLRQQGQTIAMWQLSTTFRVVSRAVRHASASMISCLGWIALSVSAALAAFLWPVDAWYATLAKPAWNPPNWLFGPVWTTLYILIGVAAWRVARTGAFGRDRAALGLFLLQWAFNFAWSGFFFGLHAPGLAAVEIVVLLALVAATIARFARHDRLAAALLAPYAAWVAFATALNLAIWSLNRG